MSVDSRGRPVWEHAPPVLMDEFNKTMTDWKAWKIVSFEQQQYWRSKYQPIEDEV